jgi:hypothetical protein
MPRAKEIFSLAIFFWHACYSLTSPDLVLGAFQEELIYTIGSPGESKISVVSTCIGRRYTLNFVFHVSPAACMDK